MRRRSNDEFNTPEAVSPKDISDLECEESDEQRRNQKAQGLKIFKTKSNTQQISDKTTAILFVLFKKTD